MRQNAAISLAMTAFFLSSCLATQLTHPKAALLEQPSAQSRKILENAIGEMLNSQPVKLADNVFTLKSEVIVEPNQPKDSRGFLLDGRDVRQADTFSLLTEGGKCYLKHEQSGQINLLGEIHCNVKN